MKKKKNEKNAKRNKMITNRKMKGGKINTVRVCVKASLGRRLHTSKAHACLLGFNGPSFGALLAAGIQVFGVQGSGFGVWGFRVF